MEVGVITFGHIVIDNNVHPLDVDTSTEKIGRDNDPFFTFLEKIVIFDSLLLAHSPENGDTLELHLVQDSIQELGPVDLRSEDDCLVVVKLFQQLHQLLGLVFLINFGIKLVKSMQGQLGLVVDVNFMERLTISGEALETFLRNFIQVSFVLPLSVAVNMQTCFLGLVLIKISWTV